jgi:outer membrane protein G
MRKILIFITIIFTFSGLNAQSWEGIGAKNVNIGYELYGNNGIGIVSTFDYGISDYVSVGVGLSYAIDLNNTYLNVRTDYHLQHTLKLPSYFDVYLGGDVGYNTDSDKQIGFGLHIGMRLSLSHYFGIYTEFGNRGNLGLYLNL